METIKTLDEAVVQGLITLPMLATKKPVTVRYAYVVEAFTVETLEGNMVAKPGNVLILGVKGEIYPCDSEIFEMTYDKDARCDTESD